MSVIKSNSEAAIFGRLIQLEKHEMSSELARYILGIRFAEEDVARMNELSAKARTGRLDSEDERELEKFKLVGDLLAI